MSFIPSSTRTYVVPSTTNNGSGYYTSTPMVIEPKSSADVLDYTFDFTQWIGTTGDTIVAPISVQAPTNPSTYSVVPVWANTDGIRVTLLLASGIPSTDMTIGFMVQTTQGRKFVVTATIMITSNSVATLPPSGQFPSGELSVATTSSISTATLPSGYGNNGGVLMTTSVSGPSGTPDFQIVSAQKYLGDGSNLSIVIDNEILSLSEWAKQIPSLATVGPQGPQGVAGPQGLQGPQGPQGLVGPQGQTGQTGQAGSTGASIRFRGTWSTDVIYGPGDFVVAPSTTNVSYMSLYGFNGPYTITANVLPGIDPSNWIEIKSPQGPAGVAGTNGINGAPGQQGPQGPQGPQGIAGQQGPQGPAGLSLNNKGAWVSGTTYNPNDYVFAPLNSSNSNTTAIYVFSGPAAYKSTTIPYDDLGNWGVLEGPQGPPGQQGQQGPQGIQGPQGPQGPAGASTTSSGDGSYITTKGVKNDGTVDCSTILANTTDTITFPAGKYLVANNVTVAGNTRFLPGAQLLLNSNVKVIFNQKLVLGDEQETFILADTTASIVCNNDRISLGWFSGLKEGTLDVGVVASAFVYDARAEGREIYFPQGTYLAITPIYISGKDFISLTGPAVTMKSNISYNPTGPNYAGGGALIETSGYAAVHDPRPASPFTRTSGLTIQNLSFSGHLGTNIKQTGVLLERDGDGTNILNCTFISFNGSPDGTNYPSCCVNLYAQDTAAMRNCWLAESSNGLAIGTGKEISIEGCKIGAQPQGISINMTNSVRCSISNNSLFPDGGSNIIMGSCSYCRVENNIMSSRFTGMVVCSNIFACSISNNTLRAPEDTNTSWWVGADPQNRDVAYGIIYLDGASCNNTLKGNDIWVYTDPNAPKATCAIRLRSGASANTVESTYFGGNASFVSSNQLIVLENDPGSHGTSYVLDSGTSAQISCSGSVVTRALQVVPDNQVAPITPNANRWRPNYHTSPPVQWMNDIQRPLEVNGKWYGWYLYNGTYFNTSSNNGTEWRQISTTNFASWRDDNLISIPKYTLTPSQGDPWTGSTVIDTNNTAGFGAGAIIAITTMSGDHAYDTGTKDSNGNEIYNKGQSNYLWYTTDITRPMTYYGLVDVNPGLYKNVEQNFRDPSVFWDTDRNRWVACEAEGYKVGFYSSTDLKTWSYIGGTTGNTIMAVGTIECPHMVKMTSGTVSKWVLFFGCNVNGTMTGYQIGNFDGSNFTPDQDKFIGTLDTGPDYYAAVVWQDSQGNTFSQGWMNNWDYAGSLPTKPSYMGNMSITRQLNLSATWDYILCNPVASQNEVFYTMINGQPMTISDNNPYPTPISASQSYRIDISLSPVNGSWPTSVRLGICEGSSDTTSITLTGSNNLLTFNRSSSGTVPVNDDHWNKNYVATVETGGACEFSVFVDNSTVEIFSADGKSVISAVIFPGASSTGRSLRCTGGSVIVNKFNVYQM